MGTYLSGRRVQISGSLLFDNNLDNLQSLHSLVKKIAKHVLSNSGGLVINVGEEPLTDTTPNVPLIFDWTLLEAVSEYLEDKDYSWLPSQGAPIVVTGFHNYLDRIPSHRRGLWEKCLDHRCFRLVTLPVNRNFGGLLRRTQAKYGDILLTFGGSIGVHDLSEIYRVNRKHSIHLDLSFDPSKRSASEALAENTLTNPFNFFEYKPEDRASIVYSKLSFKHGFPDEDGFVACLCDLLKGLTKPYVFYIRLLNPNEPDFPDVETYFRNVIDPVCEENGYRRYEAGTDGYRRGFMNVDIFEKLASSSLVIADLTGMRPNCLFEYGFSIACNKKVVCVARTGTKLPWDVLTLPCHFWSTNRDDSTRRNDLKTFMSLNLDRECIVPL